MGKSKQDGKEFDKLVLRGNIDTCNINKGMLGSFMQAVLRDQMMQHSNYHFGCPAKKGNYYAINLPPINEKLFPTYILGVSGEFQLKLTLKGKNENSKGMIQLITSNILMVIVNN